MVRRGGGVYAVMPIFEAVVGLVRFEIMTGDCIWVTISPEIFRECLRLL